MVSKGSFLALAMVPRQCTFFAQFVSLGIIKKGRHERPPSVLNNPETLRLGYKINIGQFVKDANRPRRELITF